VEGGRLMGKESAKRKSGKEEDRTLSFGRRHVCGGSGGGVSYDLTSGTEERTLGRRPLWLAGPAQRGCLRRCGPVGLVAVKHRDPQQIHLEKHQAERCGSPEEPTIQAIRHCLPFRAKPRAQPTLERNNGEWLRSAHIQPSPDRLSYTKIQDNPSSRGRSQSTPSCTRAGELN
jgi:hypothetical protein